MANQIFIQSIHSQIDFVWQTKTSHTRLHHNILLEAHNAPKWKECAPLTISNFHKQHPRCRDLPQAFTRIHPHYIVSLGHMWFNWRSLLFLVSMCSHQHHPSNSCTPFFGNLLQIIYAKSSMCFLQQLYTPSLHVFLFCSILHNTALSFSYISPAKVKYQMECTFSSTA